MPPLRRSAATTRRSRAAVSSAAAALLVASLAGCAASDEPDAAAPSTPAPTSSAPESSAPATSSSATETPEPPDDSVVIEASIADGKVSTADTRVQVERGQEVRLVLTSDIADEVHLHGYELESELMPGVRTELIFTADQAGLFELETHESGLLVLQLAVR